MKFAIIVLIILAVVSVAALFLGEFYPVRAAGPGWQKFWQQELGISAPIFSVLTFFELHDPYRSWWYQVLLLLLSLSLLTCIIERLPLAIRAMGPGDTRSADEIKNLSISHTLTLSGSAEGLINKLPLLFRFKKEQKSGEWRLSRQRGSLAHLGPILAHAGMLSLVVGGLFTSILGFSTRVSGLPGEVVTDPVFDFSVRIDSFRIEYYPLGLGQYVLVDDSFIGKIVERESDDRFILERRSHEGEFTRVSVEKERLRNRYDIQMDRGNISDYISVLTVIEGDEEILTHRVEVNKPMRHKGYRFYQTSFDTERPRVQATIDSARVALERTADETVLDTLLIAMNEPLELPNDTQLVMTRFLPDFRLQGSTAVSASGELRNPAVMLEVQNAGEELYHQWSFLRSPFHHVAANAVYSFQVLNIFGVQTDVTYATILEVNRNPGYWLIWLGFSLATLGLMLSFYVIPKRIWLAVSDKGADKCEVVVGGFCRKGKDVFSRWFDHWVQRLESRSS